MGLRGLIPIQIIMQHLRLRHKVHLCYGFSFLQVDYLLGKNNRGQSYLVGFGTNYPQRVHHRAASIVSFKQNPQFVSCRGGYEEWYVMKERNPNVLVGAVVGGPDQNDDFVDDRAAYEMTEPTTYNTAPLVGVLARLQSMMEEATITTTSTLQNPGVQFVSSYCCWIFPLLFSNFTYWVLWRTFNIAMFN
jgi:hypothetical protein